MLTHNINDKGFLLTIITFVTRSYVDTHYINGEYPMLTELTFYVDRTNFKDKGYRFFEQNIIEDKLGNMLTKKTLKTRYCKSKYFSNDLIQRFD